MLEPWKKGFSDPRWKVIESYAIKGHRIVPWKKELAKGSFRSRNHSSMRNSMTSRTFLNDLFR